MQPQAGRAHRRAWPLGRPALAAAALGAMLGVLAGVRVAGPGAPAAAALADRTAREAAGYGMAQELYPPQPADLLPTPSPSAPPSTPAPSPVSTAVRASVARRPAVVAYTGAVSASVSQVLALLDADRASGGLAPLRLDAALSRAAAVHVAAQAAQDRMFHDGYVADVDAQGVVWHGLAEVLGTWNPTPDAVAINTMWMQSSEHRPMIMNASYVAVGIAWARSSNGDWFVDVILEY